MFFKKKRNDADEVLSAEKNVELPDYVKERYNKSKYQDTIGYSLTQEDIYLLFCDKKDWSVYKNTDELHKFDYALKKIGDHAYCYISFPEYDFSEKTTYTSFLFENCIFLYFKSKSNYSFHFHECHFLDRFDVDLKSFITFRSCFFSKENFVKINSNGVDIFNSSFNSLELTANSVKILKSSVRYIQIFSEDLNISDAKINEFIFFKTGKACRSNGKPKIISLETSEIGTCRLNTEHGYIAYFSISESCISSLEAENDHEMVTGHINLSLSSIGRVTLKNMICKSIHASYVEIEEFFQAKSNESVYLLNFSGCLKYRVEIIAGGDISVNNSIGNHLVLKALSINMHKVKINEHLELKGFVKIEKCKINSINNSETISMCIEESIIINMSARCSSLYLIYSEINYLSIDLLENFTNIVSDKLDAGLFSAENKIHIRKTNINSYCDIKSNFEFNIYNCVFNKTCRIISSRYDINDSVFNEDLDISLIGSNHDNSIMLNFNEFKSLHINNCHTNGIVLSRSNTINGNLTLRRVNARRLEMELTTVFKDCDFKYLEIEKICLFKNCRFYSDLDLKFSCISYVAFLDSKLRTVDIDCFFFKEMKILHIDWFDSEGILQAMSRDNFDSEESFRIFKELHHVVAEPADVLEECPIHEPESTEELKEETDGHVKP